jgi:nitroreductase
MPMTLKRRQAGSAQALYGALGIARDDRAGRDGQFERNFKFFDAPVALVITIGRDFGSGGYLDLGMAVYGLMLAAQSHGLATCAIGALASYPNLVRHSLQLDAQCAIVCGLALGYADAAAPVNRATTTRCELNDYFRVIG